MKGKPLLSLCMIVKDEESNLPRCLNSVKGIVDEIVLVDTGSQDRTVEIGEKNGARIFHFPWSGDFSAARNYSLEQARGEWIMVLDADEELEASTGSSIRELLTENNRAQGYLFQVIDFLGEKPGVDRAINISFRLFRNRPDYRYSRSVHEQIQPQVIRSSSQSEILLTEVRVFHYGYLLDQVKKKNKFQRNIHLLEQEVQHNPDAFNYFNLGLEYMRLEQLNEAAQVFEKAITLVDPTLAFAAELFLRYALTLALLGRTDDSLAVLQEATGRYPHFTDLFYLEAEIRLFKKDYQGSLASFQRCLELGPAPLGYPSLLGVGSFRAKLGLGSVYEAVGRLDLAKKLYLEALEAVPQWKEAEAALAGLYYRLAIRTLKAGLERFPDAKALQKAILSLTPAKSADDRERTTATEGGS